MKLEKTFYTDSMKSYMILKGPADEQNAGYQYRMLSANTIGKMLSCSVRFIDNTCLFYYDVTSMQSLAVLYECRGMDRTAVRELLYSVLGAQQKLAAFLLDARRMIFDPECVFYDFEKREYLFAYYPEDLDGNDCSVLYAYLAEHVDPLDEPAVHMAYELSDIAMAQDSFLLTESYLDGLIRRASGPEAETAEPAEPAAGKEPAAPENTDEPAAQEQIFQERPAGETYPLYRDSSRYRYPGQAGLKTEMDSGTSMKSHNGIRSHGGLAGIAGAGIFTAGMILFVLRTALKTEGQADSLIRSAVVSLMMTSVILFLYSLARCFKEDTAEELRETAASAEAERIKERRDRREELMIEFGAGMEDAAWQAQDANSHGTAEQPVSRSPEQMQKMQNESAGCRLYGLGSARRYHIHLDELPCTVGSLSRFSDVVLNDQSISPLHVRFVRDGEGVSLMDLNSMFGTYLNGERAEPGLRLKLEPCDEIRIGRLEFCFR